MDIEREKKTEGQRIQDVKGNVLGYFLTEAQHTQAMYALAHREIDREEAENAAKGIPLRIVAKQFHFHSSFLMRFLLPSLLLCSPLLFAAEPPKPVYETRAKHDPDGIGKFYVGREIAQVMGHQAAGWLERPEREKEEDPAKLLAALEIKPGMTVADIGAGSGYHVFRMAPLVGDKGKILAVDIQKEMLDLMNAKAKKNNVANVETILGTEKDPKLPVNTVDLIIMVDVYHELEFPREMTEKMVAALKPGGRIVFVEFRLEDAKVPIKLVHKMTERQVTKEMAEFESTMEHSKTVKTLPWQHIVIFKKKDEKK